MSTLRRFVQAGAAPPAGTPLARFLPTRQRPAAGEVCELCAAPVPAEHRHLVDTRRHNLVCSCRGCALLFDQPGAAGGRYRAVPERYLRVEPFVLDPVQWSALQVPVGMAFFLRSSRAGRTVAFYPSPGGATESEIPLDAWEAVVAANPILAGVEADTEAALVRRGRSAECFVVPVDRCYELVGELRRHWRGFDGGSEVRARVDAFFTGVAGRARPVGGAAT